MSALATREVRRSKCANDVVRSSKAKAIASPRRAAFAAQQAQMPEALYRWEWQAGRLLKARDETEPALAAYRLAVQTLQPIRADVSLAQGFCGLALAGYEGAVPTVG